MSAPKKYGAKKTKRDSIKRAKKIIQFRIICDTVKKSTGRKKMQRKKQIYPGKKGRKIETNPTLSTM